MSTHANKVQRVCAKCGATVFADSPRGFCSVCLFKTGLGSLQDDLDGQEPSRIQMEFGDYQIIEEIGRGGEGVVYRARQKSLNRTVALKVIGLGKWSSTPHLKRFRHEAEAAASLEHPQIVPIYEIGERDGSCYFSMKFVEGGRLDEVAQTEPMSARRAAELLVKIARTVQFAHEHGILHRDIKPGNILLDKNGEPHLTDFGLARLIEQESTITNSFDVLGTPSYMAPEQAAGHTKELTAAADVYSLGAVFYQMLTGEPPFAGGTTYETIRLVLETEPRNPRTRSPKLDIDVATICLKCLEKNPANRYPTAKALAEDLERWLRHEPIQARRTGIFSRAGKWVRRNPAVTTLAAVIVALALVVGTLWWRTLSARLPQSGIAVLPFENLSDEKEHAFFADGVQDDILIKLAKIADLKVISRTSVMQYRGKQDVRQIGNALRVSHVLEGTVRRSDGKVHVNAQLVDARTDAGIWAEEYDRDLNEVFAIETEVAQSTANRLRAKVSAREKAAMQERPTTDLVAYDRYIRAAALIDQADFAPDKEQEKDLFQAVELLNAAIGRDPAFLLAYCRLAEAHDALYFQGVDHTPARLDLANSAINAAFRLKPDSGEAHLALATHFYHGYFDYDHARDELAIAVHTLPNNARIFEWSGYIDRRQGRWHDAARNFEHASELDPRNVRILISAAAPYLGLREYKQARVAIDRLIALEPNNVSHRLRRGWVDVRERADTGAVHAAFEMILKDNAVWTGNLMSQRFYLALWERDPVAADGALAALTENNTVSRTGGMVKFGRDYVQGLIARMKGDTVAARAAFSAARAQQEEAVRARPDDGAALCVLGLIDAALGRKEEALREGRRAVDLLPLAKNALDGPDVLYSYAVICAWTGERDLAIEQLQTLTKIPAGAHYGDLRLDPDWDPLRGDPRFEKIVASLAPKEMVSK